MKKSRFEGLLACAASHFSEGSFLTDRWKKSHDLSINEKEQLCRVIGKILFQSIKNRGIKILVNNAGLKLEEE